MADVNGQLADVARLRDERDEVNAEIERLKIKARALSEEIRKTENVIPRDKHGRVVMVSQPAKVGARGRRVGG